MKLLDPTSELAWLVALGVVERVESPDEVLRRLEVFEEVEKFESPEEELGNLGDPEEELRKCEYLEV